MDGLGTSTRQQVTSIGNQNGETEDNNCSATLLEEALNCPICCEVPTSPIFQCKNGHIVCSTCCNNLVSKKCPTCARSIGDIRCRAMERVIKAVIVPCPNSKHGCENKSFYGKEVTHEKECTFSPCSCPVWYCDYTGSYKDLFSHFDSHKDVGRYNYRFLFGESVETYFELTTHYLSVVMKEHKEGLLFVVQFFTEQPHGVYVTMSCIAPCALEVGEFSCHISTVVEKYNMTVELPSVKRVRKLSLHSPKEDFMLVPSYILRGSQSLKLKIRVRKLSQE